jgi:hypothetical protein
MMYLFVYSECLNYSIDHNYFNFHYNKFPTLLYQNYNRLIYCSVINKLSLLIFFFEYVLMVVYILFNINLKFNYDDKLNYYLKVKVVKYFNYFNYFDFFKN